MTDKEMAEEYCNNEVPFDTTESGEKLYIENDLKQAYLAGLKAGRPKWHKVADGDLPKECENVWCYCKGPGIKFYCVGHTIVNGNNKVRWWANNKTEELRVIAWKEIVFPKGV